MSKNFIQYELWKDCRNNCRFCTNLSQKDINKIESLNFVINDINTIDIQEADLGLIGGEFFDNQLENEEIKTKFYELFKYIKEKVENNNIKRIFITSSLIFDINIYLIPFFNYLKELNILNKVVLCTSYDIKYRFHTENQKILWENNMLTLYNMFPEIILHTQTILTGFFIDAVLTNNFNIVDFCNKFHTTIDYNEPQSGFYYTKEEMKKKLPDFYPTKAQFVNFIRKAIIQDMSINPDTFLMRELHADRLYYTFEGKQYLLENRHNKANFYSKIVEGKNELGFYDSDKNMADFAQELLEGYI